MNTENSSEANTAELLTLRTVFLSAREVTYYLNSDNKLHRIHGPAAIFTDGILMWYYDGNLHREDGPAVIIPDRFEYWYKHGICTAMVDIAKD